MTKQDMQIVTNLAQAKTLIEQLEEEIVELNRCVEQERQKVKEYEDQERYLLARLEKAESESQR